MSIIEGRGVSAKRGSTVSTPLYTRLFLQSCVHVNVTNLTSSLAQSSQCNTCHGNYTVEPLIADTSHPSIMDTY